MKLIKLLIPFATVGFIKKLNENDELCIKGNAVFIFDINNSILVDEYLHLEKANFRKTDNEMKKPTAYYKQKNVKEFRDNFLDKFTNFNNNYKKQILSNDQIDIINNYFKTLNTTVLQMFSLLSGSNTTGAEQNHKATPLKCIDPEFFLCNFANIIKKYRLKNSQKIKYDESNIKTYQLKDIINSKIINNFQEFFYEYNFKKYDPDNNIINYFKKEEDNCINKINFENETFKLNEDQNLFINSILNNMFSKNNDPVIKSRLRYYYSKNVNNYVNNNLIPDNATLENYDESVLENAHIIPFNYLLNQKTYNSLKSAIDPYNCLRINKDTHKMYDSMKIYFDNYGFINYIKSSFEKRKFLDIKKIPKPTIKYIEQYNKKFLYEFINNS